MWPNRRSFGELKATWAKSSRRQLLRMMISSSPGLSIAILVWILLNAALPNLLAIITGRIVADLPGAIREGLQSSSGRQLSGAVVVFAAVFAAMLVTMPIRVGLAAIAKVRFTYDMQSRVMRAVTGPIGIEHLEDPRLLDRIELAQGSLMSQYPADAAMTLAQVVARRLQGGLACILIASYRWWLGIIFAVLWLAAGRALRSIVRGQVKAATDDADIARRSRYFGALATRAPAAKEIRIFGLGSWVVGELRRHFLDSMRASWAHTARWYRQIPAISGAILIVFLGACAYLAHSAYIGATSISSVVVVLALLQRSNLVGILAGADVSLAWMLSSYPELDELERELSRFRSEFAGSELPDGVPERSIEFESISFRYPGAASDVFSDLNLSIPAGRSTAIVGVNGAGKTSLVKLLARLHEPTHGRITVDGRDVRDFDPHAWQARIAVVFQDFNQYPLSAWENIQIGALEYEEDREGARRAAERAGALDFIEALPRGWETILARQYEGGTELSGGQWQRVALARALFAAEHGANVLILDEPTSWLDVRGEAAFYQRFLEITEGLTTIVISHRFSTVRLADQICVLDAGGVVERGSHDELLVIGGTYAEMFRMQASRFAGPDDLEASAR